MDLRSPPSSISSRLTSLMRGSAKVLKVWIGSKGVKIFLGNKTLPEMNWELRSTKWRLYCQMFWLDLLFGAIHKISFLLNKSNVKSSQLFSVTKKNPLEQKRKQNERQTNEKVNDTQLVVFRLSLSLSNFHQTIIMKPLTHPRAI